MGEEMKQEAIELVVTACEKHGANNEVNKYLISLSLQHPGFGGASLTYSK
jgi:hypothetical protein